MGLPGCPTAELSWYAYAQGWATRSCTLAAAGAHTARRPAAHPARAMQHNQDSASQSFLGPHTGLVCCGDLSEYWPSMQCLVGEESIVQEKEALQACLLRRIRNGDAAHAVHHDK